MQRAPSKPDIKSVPESQEPGETERGKSGRGEEGFTVLYCTFQVRKADSEEKTLQYVQHTMMSSTVAVIT